MPDTPEQQLAAYLRETEPALPERYRKPGAGARPRPALGNLIAALRKWLTGGS